MDRNALCCQQHREETFFHPNKTDRAEIDYIFFSKNGENLVKSVAVERCTSLNTSDHVPVHTHINIETCEKSRAVATVIQLKPKWAKCDKIMYKRSIRQNLLSFDTFLPASTAETDILQPLAHLNAVLKQATKDSIPNYKSSMKVKNKKRCWTQRIQDAMKHSRLMWWEWRKAGEPENQDHPARQRMKQAKQLLRKEQRLEAAKQRNARIEDIMSSDNSSSTFFKVQVGKDQAKGAIRKRFPLQKPRWEKTKLTIRHLYHETYRKPNEQLFSQ